MSSSSNSKRGNDRLRVLEYKAHRPCCLTLLGGLSCVTTVCEAPSSSSSSSLPVFFPSSPSPIIAIVTIVITTTIVIIVIAIVDTTTVVIILISLHLSRLHCCIFSPSPVVATRNYIHLSLLLFFNSPSRSYSCLAFLPCLVLPITIYLLALFAHHPHHLQVSALLAGSAMALDVYAIYFNSHDGDSSSSSSSSTQPGTSSGGGGGGGQLLTFSDYWGLMQVLMTDSRK
jgi:hypothetical protein